MEKSTIIFLFLGYLGVMCLFSLLVQYRIRNWPFVWGRLVKSKVKEAGSDNVKSEKNFIIDLSYEYSLNDKKFFGSRLSAMPVMTTYNVKGLLHKQLKGAEFKGDEVKVFYNPRKPSKSYLVNGSKYQLGFTLLMLLFVIFLMSQQ